MMDAMLRSPAMRVGLTPLFEPHDVVENGLRIKRIRQWAGHGNAAKILPWVALNPSGFNKSGRGLSGRTMARLAYLWGFDGVATYNIVPFEGSNPERDIWPLLREGGRESEIRDAHDSTAADLKDADALVVGWGSKGGPFGAEIERLAKQLIASINAHPARSVPLRLWHAGLNDDRTPKHAGARGKSAIPANARPFEFSF